MIQYQSISANNLFKKCLLLPSLMLLGVLMMNMSVFGQAEYQPYSYQFHQKLNRVLYSTKTREHTSLKPFLMDSLLKFTTDSILNFGSETRASGWGYRKLFNEHLIDIKSKNSTFYTDLLPDLSIGRDLSGSKTTSLTSVGLQIGGTVGDQFFYAVSGYVNRGVFPNYLDTYINQVGIIPGEAAAHGEGAYNWSFIRAVVSYTPLKYLNISAGRDKMFIGDGYRSMLLSDAASPYPFFKLTGNLGNVTYMAMWTYMNDPASTSPYHINRKKFGVFHYLDWNVSNRLFLGFFDNLIGFYTDDNGQKRPFDFNYINPIIFTKPVNNSSDNPDKSLLGFTGKYKVSDGITAYGQFALNEFVARNFFSGNGASVNKFGWQLGLRGADLFKIKRLNYLLETNGAKPFTYSARSAIENYSVNGEPLAHPWGANFREVVGLLNYSFKRFDFGGEIDLGKYGLDVNGLNYGKDIFKLYTSPAKEYGNYIGQGLLTHLVYFQGKAAFLLNPKYNLRIELNGTFRSEKNDLFTDRSTVFSLGLRSSFRNIYTDLSSYKVH
ncbi:MAG: gliding motility protein RemB [Candidatus Pedobacter colombiensis]|uniref:Gliding motility protein RemB n=1 Tax=Candidatus Pedobacter colombiensis TaxID=3121371 RepID=A0AAJ5W8F9_9SPHI|nr:gliding motility protein RemB [Pedobacter sp.]WEK18974.1 MAG: gliding motility protein RemB [Pedobacter sp.]